MWPDHFETRNRAISAQGTLTPRSYPQMRVPNPSSRKSCVFASVVDMQISPTDRSETQTPPVSLETRFSPRLTHRTRFTDLVPVFCCDDSCSIVRFRHHSGKHVRQIRSAGRIRDSSMPLDVR